MNSIICIRQSRISKGFYTTGGTGYQLEWDVWLVKWPEGTLLGNRKFTEGTRPRLYERAAIITEALRKRN